MKAKNFLIVAIVFLFAFSCTSSDPELEIEKLLDTRAKAISTKNIELYKSCLAKNYQAPAEKMREHFEFWDAIEMRILDRSIVLKSADEAVVYQKYQFRVKKNGRWQVLKPAVEKLIVIREGKIFKRWKIAKGLLPNEYSGDKPD